MKLHAACAVLRRWTPMHETTPLRLDAIELLVDGEQAFPAWLEAIESARSEILLDMYWFASDPVGWRFAEAIAARARAGVRTLVVYDPLGSVGTDRALFRHLERAGARVEAFHPLRSSKGLPLVRLLSARDHRKLLVVDGQTAFVGGINISREAAPRAWGGDGWRDCAARIRGRGAHAVRRLFAEMWRWLTGEHLAPDSRADTALPRGLEIVGHGAPTSDHEVRDRYVSVIRRATRRVWLANAYFVPDRRTLGALRRAAARGVDVRVLVPGQPDVPLVAHASRALYGPLLGRGVRIFEWQPSMMHAKTCVTEGCGIVGSYNLDQWSARHNFEVVVVSMAPTFVRELAGAFERDLASCREVSPDDYARRGWLQQALERVGLLFSAWL